MKNKVHIYREEKNLTQNELAEKSGLSLRTIQRIEGGNIPKGFTLKSLAKALETEPEKLLSDEEEKMELERAKLINIASLSFIILPFGNIIIPAILTYKTKNQKTKKLGKEIISIQVVWTMITSVLMIVSPFIQRQFFMKFSLAILCLVILVCVNVVIIIKNGISLDRRSDLCIRLKNNIL